MQARTLTHTHMHTHTQMQAHELKHTLALTVLLSICLSLPPSLLSATEALITISLAFHIKDWIMETKLSRLNSPLVEMGPLQYHVLTVN